MSNLSAKPGCLGFLVKLFRDTGKQPAEHWPYRRKDFLLSKAEFSFYRVLQQVVGERWVICPKIGLGDLLLVQKGTQQWQSWRNKIDRKHVDFVLCDPQTMKPLVVIELDDVSHKSESAKQRDADKDRALMAAGLPILRVPAQRTYDGRKILSQINAAIDT